MERCYNNVSEDKMKRAILSVIFLASLFLFVSCESENIVGYWESAYGEFKDELREAVRIFTIDIREDGTASFTYAKETQETTWTEKDGYYQIFLDEEYKAWIENNVLVIDMEDVDLKMFLVKDLKNFKFPPNIKKGVRLE